MATRKQSRGHEAQSIKVAGILYVVATPIGNLEDMTYRAVRILDEVDLIACEDTRQTRKLLSHFNISTPLISYYKDKEKSRTEKLIRQLESSKSVALVSDAGTPAVSDPGGVLVQAARENGIKVIPVPGPSALTAAISVAGLENGSFVFLGFLPSKSSERRTLLTSMVHERRSIVFYESPHRLKTSLKDCFTILGDRNMFWARELTKIHEELTMDSLSGLLDNISAREVKGESVVVIEGSKAEQAPASEDIVELLLWHRDNTEMSLKDVVSKVTRELGLSRSKVYSEALKIWKK